MTDEADTEATDEAEQWKAPEPQSVAGAKVQDNVSTPGVQRTTHPDGSVQEHGEAIEADGDEPDDVEAADPGAEPVSDLVEVTVSLVAGEGWVDAPLDPAKVEGAALPEGFTGEVHTSPSTDQEGATCVTVDGAPDDIDTVIVTLTVAVPSPPAS